MKRIVKQEAPAWFDAWKDEFEAAYGRKPHYKNDFSTGDKDGRNRRTMLRQQLVAEQGRICCYCMKRITVNTSHIEHFWPKEYFRDMDLDYQNLFASCSGEGGMFLNEEHCGHRKANWWRADMIPPSDIRVEEMFRYSVNGKISSVPGRGFSNLAQEMIHNLGLDSYHLERNRRQAVEGSEVFGREDYTEEDIRSFIDYYSNMDDGAYVPYCQAIVDCLSHML